MADLVFSHGGNIHEVKGANNKGVIDFSANINPLGLPVRIRKAIDDNFDKILHYPDPNSRMITKKIAEYWGISEQNVLLANGSIELIYLIIKAFKPEDIFMPVPTFTEYERAAKTVKSKIHFLKLKEKEGFRFDLSKVVRSDISFLCNPNNPTGNLILEGRRKVEELARKIVVIDEAFLDFLPDQKNDTLIWKAAKSRKIVVLRSFTKFFAMPGLRIGYLVAHKAIIDKLKRHLPPWNTNVLGQIAAGLILNDKKYADKTYRLIERERKFLLAQLAGIDGFKPYPSVINFILIRIEKKGITSTSFKKMLIKKGILIRDCGNFRGLNDKYVRVAVRSHRENLLLVSAMKEILWKG